MNAALILAHALAIVHGIGAALACGAAFYLVGSALIPGRCNGPGRGERSAMAGAAAYVLLCWLGVGFGLTVARLTTVFAAVVLAAAIARSRAAIAAFGLRAIFTRRTAGWLLSFSVLYVVAYVFTMPPVTRDYLPAAWTGNIDLLMYLQYAKRLFQSGAAGLTTFPYQADVYLQTPAVFYLLGLWSRFFGNDPLQAAMPAMFAVTALVGLVIARMSREVFKLSRTAATAIGCLVLSGSFFRYISGAYYLSTMMSAPVLLYLIWLTIDAPPPGPVDATARRDLFDAGLAVRAGTAYILLLFLYPFLLVAGILAQAAIVGLMLMADAQSREAGPAWRDAARRAGRTTFSLLAPLVLIAAAFFRHVVWSIDMVRALSAVGVAGWPLDIISPLALLSVPTVRADHNQCGGCLGIEVTNPAGRAWAIAAFLAVGGGLALVYFWKFRRSTTCQQRTLAALAGGSFIAYTAYFLHVGASYQQWKLASYSALFLAFVVFAGALQLLQQSRFVAGTAATPSGRGRRRLTVVQALLACAFVGGNLLVHTLRDPEMATLPGELRNMAMLDNIRSFRDIWVDMDDRYNTYATEMSFYFMPSKRVHVISPRFEPSEPLSYERISPDRPLLLEHYGCEGVGHADTIAVGELGCVLLAPPSLALDTPFPFNQSFLFVEVEGLGAREPEGRWNSGSTVVLKLAVDLKRIWAFDDHYVNLQITPYLPPGTTRQRLVLSWGLDRHAQVSLERPDRISVPIQRADWTGERVWTVPISVALPDAIEPPRMYAPRGSEGRGPLAVVFEELSISAHPLGRVVTADAGEARAAAPPWSATNGPSAHRPARPDASNRRSRD